MTERVPDTPTTGPELERLAHQYSVMPEQLPDLLADLRRQHDAAMARHRRVLAGAARVAGIVVEVCEHHGPQPGLRRLYCSGCDDDETGMPPGWPCSTWTMIAQEVGE